MWNALFVGCYSFYNYIYFSIVPEDSPQNFTSQPTKTTVIFTWTKPATPNGIIIKYFLIVTNLDTSTRYDYTVNVTANQVTVSQVTDGFSPYQNYTASVSASTIFGAGPVATTIGRTLPDGKIVYSLKLCLYYSASSPPNLIMSPVIINGLTVAYTLPVLNDTTINITWSPPSYPNGEISGYIVRIATDAITSPNNVPFVPNKVSYTLIFGGLS